MMDRLQQLVARDHASPHAIGVIDETGCPKKGDKTPGVQRQYCGAVGKVENCVVTVHLGYAVDDFHCLLANDLFLPEAGPMTATAVGKPAFPTRLCIGPSGRSLWTCSTERWPTVSSSPG